MATIRGPRIVTSGLVLALDAADRKSYVGSGTAWNDLSGNGNNSTLVNGPTFSSTYGGRFFFNAGASQRVTTTLNSTEVPKASNFTFEIWLYQPTLPDATAKCIVQLNNWTSYTPYVAGNDIFLSSGSSNFTIHFRNYNDSNGSVWLSTNLSYERFYHYAFVRIGNTFYSYINGSSVASGAYTENTINSNVTFTIGSTFTGSDYFDGYIHSVRVYTKGLSAAEVLQNFNASRRRFGI